MRPRLLVFVLLAAAALAATHAAGGEPLQLAPIKGVVLLRNGQVLSGTIARTGDYYYVSLPRGEIRLKTSEVEKVASRLDDLYEEKRGRMEPGKLQDRLDLAEWCVEQRLVEQAAKELADATALQPRHPRIALIQRRLELAQQGEREPTAAPVSVDAGPSIEELDRFVRGLPGHAVETFTSTIQPMLVNNCTASGCHGARSQGKLKLLRISMSAPLNRRLTQRNLYAAWQVIDPTQPEASPLLTQPIRPHGKAKGPIFSGREAAQYRQLVAWVYEATRQRKPHEKSLDEQPEPPPGEVAGNRPKRKRRAVLTPPPDDSDDAPPAMDDADELAEQHSEDESEESLSTPRSSKPPRDNQRSQPYEPVDLFDAEVFNRRYLP